MWGTWSDTAGSTVVAAGFLTCPVCLTLDWGASRSRGAALGCCRAPGWERGDVALQQHAPAGRGVGEGRRGNADNHCFLSWDAKLGAKTDSTSLLHTVYSMARFLCNRKHWRVQFCQAVGGGQKILLLMVGEWGRGLWKRRGERKHLTFTKLRWIFFFYLNIFKVCGFPYISRKSTWSVDT